MSDQGMHKAMAMGMPDAVADQRKRREKALGRGEYSPDSLRALMTIISEVRMNSTDEDKKMFSDVTVPVYRSMIERVLTDLDHVPSELLHRSLQDRRQSEEVVGQQTLKYLEEDEWALTKNNTYTWENVGRCLEGVAQMLEQKAKESTT